MIPARRILSLFAISPLPRRVLMLGAVLAVLVSCFILLVLLPADRMVRDDPTSTTGPEAALFSFGLFVLPGMALFLVLAALFEKRSPPRAVLWLAAALAVALGGSGLGVLMALDSDLSFTSSAVFVLTNVVSLSLLFSMPGVYYALRTIPEIRAVLQSGLADRVLAFILAHGEISFADLAARTGLPLDQVDNLLDDLLRSGRLAGFMDAPRQRVYTAACLAEKQRLLLEIVRTRGRIHLDELARSLAVPPSLARDWVYQIVDRGQFNGAVNWGQGWLYAATAQKIGPNSQCPHCGGQLSPAPHETIVCLHCGAEVFAGQG